MLPQPSHGAALVGNEERLRRGRQLQALTLVVLNLLRPEVEAVALIEMFIETGIELCSSHRHFDTKAHVVGDGSMIEAVGPALADSSPGLLKGWEVL